MAREGAQARELAQQRTAACAGGTAARKKTAQIGGLDRAKRGKIRRLAVMFAQETEELAEVAAVGVERVAGDAALAGEFSQPFPRHRGEFRFGAAKGEGRGCLRRGVGHVRSCLAAAEGKVSGPASRAS